MHQQGYFSQLFRYRSRQQRHQQIDRGGSNVRQGIKAYKSNSNSYNSLNGQRDVRGRTNQTNNIGGYSYINNDSTNKHHKMAQLSNDIASNSKVSNQIVLNSKHQSKHSTTIQPQPIRRSSVKSVVPYEQFPIAVTQKKDRQEWNRVEYLEEETSNYDSLIDGMIWGDGNNLDKRVQNKNCQLRDITLNSCNMQENSTMRLPYDEYIKRQTQQFSKQNEPVRKSNIVHSRQQLSSQIGKETSCGKRKDGYRAKQNISNNSKVQGRQRVSRVKQADSINNNDNEGAWKRKEDSSKPKINHSNHREGKGRINDKPSNNITNRSPKTLKSAQTINKVKINSSHQNILKSQPNFDQILSEKAQIYEQAIRVFVLWFTETYWWLMGRKSSTGRSQILEISQTAQLSQLLLIALENKFHQLAPKLLPFIDKLNIKQQLEVRDKEERGRRQDSMEVDGIDGGLLRGGHRIEHTNITKLLKVPQNKSNYSKQHTRLDTFPSQSDMSEMSFGVQFAYECSINNFKGNNNNNNSNNNNNEGIIQQKVSILAQAVSNLIQTFNQNRNNSGLDEGLIERVFYGEVARNGGNSCELDNLVDKREGLQGAEEDSNSKRQESISMFQQDEHNSKDQLIDENGRVTRRLFESMENNQANFGGLINNSKLITQSEILEEQCNIVAANNWFQKLHNNCADNLVNVAKNSNQNEQKCRANNRNIEQGYCQQYSQSLSIVDSLEGQKVYGQIKQNHFVAQNVFGKKEQQNWLRTGREESNGVKRRLYKDEILVDRVEREQCQSNQMQIQNYQHQSPLPSKSPLKLIALHSVHNPISQNYLQFTRGQCIVLLKMVEKGLSDNIQQGQGQLGDQRQKGDLWIGQCGDRIGYVRMRDIVGENRERGMGDSELKR